MGRVKGDTPRKRRHQKQVDNEVDDDEVAISEEEDQGDDNTSPDHHLTDEDLSIATLAAAQRKKRKLNVRTKEGPGPSLVADDCDNRIRKHGLSTGFRHHTRRRKGKPCRAALPTLLI